MKLKRKKTFINWFVTRHQVVIRNEGDLAERSTFSLSYAKLITLIFFTLILFLGLGLFLSHTILKKWLNPAYIEQENNNKLLHLYTTVKKLEEKNAQQDKFIKLFQSILEEKGEPKYAVEDILGGELGNQPTTLNEKDTLESTDVNDNLSVVDKEVHVSRSELAAASYQLPSYLPDVVLFTPIEGMITTPFNVQIEHYGLDIVGKENEPIKCIADGTVILSTWTVETGWIIAVQHAKNLISIYKHNATLLKKVGNFVKSGEVIAIMGNSGEFSTGPHLHFELWYEGNPVNPEKFITF